VGSLNGWLRLAAAGTPLRLTSAIDAPVICRINRVFFYRVP
jgi:hypothetical protein